MTSSPGDPTAPDLGVGGPAEQKRLENLWRVLVARRRVIVATLGAVVLTAMILTILSAPLYQATATIQIEQVGPDILNFKDVVSADSSYTGNWKFYQTQYKLLRSQAVLKDAAETLDLGNRPDFATRKDAPIFRLARKLATWIHGAKPEDPAEEMIAYIDKGLAIRPVKDSQLVEISFTSRSPETARDVANAVAQAYLVFSFQSKFNTTELATDFLTKQVQRMSDEIAKRESDLQAYGSEKDIVAVTEGGADIAETALGDLSRQYVEARSRMAVAEARHASLRDSSPDSLPEVLNSPLISKLKEQYAEVERRYSQMAERFKDDWPALQQLRQELDQAATRLDDEAATIADQVRQVAQADYERARHEVARLEAQLDEQKVLVKRVQRDSVQYAGIKAEIDTKRNILAGLVARQTQTATSKELTAKTSNIRIIDRAQVPKKPVSPKKLTNLVLSLLMGAFLGTGMALLLEHLDNTIKTGQDIARLTGLGVLGHLPLYQPLRDAGAEPPRGLASARTDLASHLDPRGSFAEAFRSLRTSLLLAAPDHPPRHLMVTSCQPREGKSTVSLNLAVVLTQLGRRVLLIDADLRVPRLHRVFTLPNQVGLSSYLSGNSGLEEIVTETEIPNLKVILSGPIPPNPSELMGSPRLAALLHKLSEEGAFDYLVFDSSPLLSVSDPFILASHLDATIVVVRAGETTRESLVHAHTRLRQSRARVIGAVLNGVTAALGDYYYGYGQYGYEPRDGDLASDDGTSAGVGSPLPRRRRAHRA